MKKQYEIPAIEVELVELESLLTDSLGVYDDDPVTDSNEILTRIVYIEMN